MCAAPASRSSHALRSKPRVPSATTRQAGKSRLISASQSSSASKLAAVASIAMRLAGRTCTSSRHSSRLRVSYTRSEPRRGARRNATAHFPVRSQTMSRGEVFLVFSGRIAADRQVLRDWSAGRANRLPGQARGPASARDTRQGREEAGCRTSPSPYGRDPWKR